MNKPKWQKEADLTKELLLIPCSMNRCCNAELIAKKEVNKNIINQIATDTIFQDLVILAEDEDDFIEIAEFCLNYKGKNNE